MIFRPPASCRLAVPHVQQTQPGDCLAACAAMICTYLNISHNYNHLFRALAIEQGIGTPFSRIRNLAKLGITVDYQEYGTLPELYNLLRAGWPSIVSVQTAELPYWNQISTQHAVVVIGMDENHVLINDPEFPQAPLQVPLGDFDLAWLAQDELYAILSLP
jgi:ABC-type bacteriocin/lantibiotic exporter with double-glycine peptidase domain